MAKNVDLDKTLYDLTTEYPELIDILFDIGFMGVKNPVMRESHGKQMTVRTGCGHLGIDLGEVAAALRAKGFTVKE
ncbi:MAG: hypothetical protein A3J70_10295 [Elusimicrobia bacterium RIFCSPHIGHO2_02_FULL_61_10]|nr:MAG: hypothetical protein A3I76_08290 [Elusimicrobia bacterium RIFCSPLOWO2_02_FULL_61_11]OGS26657.1 MAG: hypothetical protein A3J70_10295 [Elusimicrobia bacterium RIFCSPHIGHO2_02_FULL_61_10]